LGVLFATFFGFAAFFDFDCFFAITRCLKVKE
jgi:hypothetical protein